MPQLPCAFAKKSRSRSAKTPDNASHGLWRRPHCHEHAPIRLVAAAHHFRLLVKPMERSSIRSVELQVESPPVSREPSFQCHQQIINAFARPRGNRDSLAAGALQSGSAICVESIDLIPYFDQFFVSAVDAEVF